MSHGIFRPLLIKLNCMEDLVRISSITHPIVYCQKRGRRYIYFTYDRGGSLIVVYYFISEKPVNYKYSIHNGMDDSVSFTNKIILDPKIKQIPIITIADQNFILIPEENIQI